MSSPPFFRRHRRVLPVLGAGVVLATFFIREVKSDDLKDLLADIQRARDLALMKKQFDNFLEHIPTKPYEAQRDKYADIRQAVEEERKYLRDIEVNILAAENLTVAARLGPAAIGEVAEMKQLLKEMNAALNEAAPNAWASILGKSSDRATEADRASSKLDEIIPHIGELVTRSEAYSKFVESAVEEKKAAAEKSFKLYNKISYWFLFPLGWLLGLAGKLLGSDAEAVGDE